MSTNEEFKLITFVQNICKDMPPNKAGPNMICTQYARTFAQKADGTGPRTETTEHVGIAQLFEELEEYLKRDQ